MIGGPFAATSPIRWPAVATATAVAIVAQFAALRVRQGTRTVYFAWGEASLIIVAYLVPAGWVPLGSGSDSPSAMACSCFGRTHDGPFRRP